MAGFGIQKRGTSKILIARKKFSEGSYPLMEEVPEPKMERMPSNEDKDYTPEKERMPSNDNKDYTPKKARISSDDNKYFTKETRLGKNQFKVERVKKSDDEIGYRRSRKAKGGLTKIAKDLKKSSSMHLKQSKTLDKLLKKEKNNG